MRGRWVAVLSVVVLGLVTGCHSGNTRSSTPPSTDSTGPATLTTAPPGAHCRSASTISNAGAFAPTVHGTGHGASLWGLLMFPHPLPARVGDQEKIVWRITSSGPLVLKAIGPNGQSHPLAWGPAEHLGSNWNKPGDEFGAGYVFTQPGCWDLRATRGHATANVWLDVVRR